MLPEATTAPSPKRGVGMRRDREPDYQLQQWAAELSRGAALAEKLLIADPELGRLAGLAELADRLDEAAHHAGRAAICATDLRHTREILNGLDPRHPPGGVRGSGE
jgi:hypothetical protein